MEGHYGVMGGGMGGHWGWPKGAIGDMSGEDLGEPGGGHWGHEGPLGGVTRGDIGGSPPPPLMGLLNGPPGPHCPYKDRAALRGGGGGGGAATCGVVGPPIGRGGGGLMTPL